MVFWDARLQLAVPVALVLVALWAGKAYVNAPDEPALPISMCAAGLRCPERQVVLNGSIRGLMD